MTTCQCCSIAHDLAVADSEGIHAVGLRWTLNRNVDAARPALVLQTRRHVPHVGELTRVEADELAQALPTADEALRAVTGAHRTHILLLAEAAAHVHWHLVPRYADDPAGTTGTALLSLAPTEREPADVASRVAERVQAGMRGVARPPEPAPVVRAAVAMLGRVQRFTPYDGVLRRWRGPVGRDPDPPTFPRFIESLLSRIGQPVGVRRSADAASVYVMAWLALLVALSAVSATWPHAALVPFIAVLAAYRAIDVASFQLRSLLDRRASMLASFERTLLFLGLNIAEMALALGTLLVAWDGRPAGAAFRDAFGVVTLTDAPPTPSLGSFALRVIFTGISITLLAGAGGVVLGLVGRDVEEAAHETKPPGIASDDG